MLARGYGHLGEVDGENGNWVVNGTFANGKGGVGGRG